MNGRPQNGVANAGTMGNVNSLQPERMISDCAVYLAKSYVVDGVGQMDILSRTVEVGVFNTMLDRNRGYKDYKTASRNIRVYDNNADDWAEITLEEAIQHCIAWDDNGDVADPFTSGPLARRGTQGLSESSIEGQNDFLRFGQGNTRHEVRYVGDLDPKWITASQLTAAGQTLYNAIVRQRAGGFGLDAKADLTMEVLLDEASNLLGADNLFFGNVPSGTRQEVLQLAMTGAKEIAVVPRKAPRAPEPGQGPETIDTEAKNVECLTNVIGSLVPSTHKGELAKIVSKKDVDWKTRAEQVESLILSCHADDPASVSAMQDAGAISRFVKRSVSQHARKLEEHAASIGSSAAGSSSQQRIKYIAVGTPLPQGYEYLNAQEEAKAKSAGSSKACPTSLRDFHFLSEVFEGGAEASASSSFGRPGARGRQNIGKAADVLGGDFSLRPGARDEPKNETPEERKERIKLLRVKDRYANIDHHIAKIAATR